ncbi:MAG: zinc ribbon domain-containing protein [Thermodesulfobacteriota bacterium]|nr:zinc ribbon domain-containing protein [Thermodesulfobacteriota bacterium]
MAFETREQVLEKILDQEKPKCPYCGQEMSIWDVPSIPMGDGLGWGEPFLFVCFNDECSLYTQGWDKVQEDYGHTASYRCMCYPSSGKFECMPVFGKLGGAGQVVDDQVLMEQEVLKEAIKKGFSILAGCYVEKDAETILRLLLDPTEPAKVRLKAAEMIGDIGSLEAIDPIKNLKIGNEIIQKQMDESVKKMHKRHFTRECPFCAEIIKERAKICKHCGKEVAGL